MNVRHLLLAVIVLSLAGAACNFGKSKADLATDAVQRGLQAYSEGRLDAAAAAYHDALDQDPRNKFALYNLGLIDQTEGRPRSAENYYRLALSVDPDFTSALFNLAILRTAAGDTREATDLYRQVIALIPNDAGPHLNLGILLRSIGQQAEGDAEVQRAVQLNPGIEARLTPTPSQTSGPQPARSPGP